MKRIAAAAAIALAIYGLAVGAGSLLYATGTIATGATHNDCDRAVIARTLQKLHEGVPAGHLTGLLVDGAPQDKLVEYGHIRRLAGEELSADPDLRLTRLVAQVKMENGLTEGEIVHAARAAKQSPEAGPRTFAAAITVCRRINGRRLNRLPQAVAAAHEFRLDDATLEKALKSTPQGKNVMPEVVHTVRAFTGTIADVAEAPSGYEYLKQASNNPTVASGKRVAWRYLVNITGIQNDDSVQEFLNQFPDHEVANVVAAISLAANSAHMHAVNIGRPGEYPRVFADWLRRANLAVPIARRLNLRGENLMWYYAYAPMFADGGFE